jgi:hypothetical protein
MNEMIKREIEVLVEEIDNEEGEREENEDREGNLGEGAIMGEYEHEHEGYHG